MNCKNYLIGAILIVLISPAANSAIITLNTSDNPFDAGVRNQGWWSATLANTNTSDAYVTGDLSGDRLRNFFTFDLSGITETVVSAELRLTRYDVGGMSSSETLTFYDVSTDAAILNNNTGTSTSIFFDLGNGTSYGQFNIDKTSGASSDVLIFNLNASSVSDINGALGGRFSIGGSLGSELALNDRLFAGSSAAGGTQSLIITTVPVPAAVWLFGSGLIGFMGFVRKRKVV